MRVFSNIYHSAGLIKALLQEKKTKLQNYYIFAVLHSSSSGGNYSDVCYFNNTTTFRQMAQGFCTLGKQNQNTEPTYRNTSYARVAPVGIQPLKPFI